MSWNKFQNDLIHGQVGEEIIGRFLLRNGHTHVNYYSLKSYDIRAINRAHNKVYYEVKTDMYEVYKGRTGNIFLEWRCSNKPSGLQTTSADWFVYYLPIDSEAWFAKPDTLRGLIKAGAFSPYYGAGDGERVFSYLLNRYEFRQHFFIHKIPTDLNNILMKK